MQVRTAAIKEGIARFWTSISRTGIIWENGDEAMEVVVAWKVWNDSVKSNTQSARWHNNISVAGMLWALETLLAAPPRSYCIHRPDDVPVLLLDLSTTQKVTVGLVLMKYSLRDDLGDTYLAIDHGSSIDLFSIMSHQCCQHTRIEGRMTPLQLAT